MTATALALAALIVAPAPAQDGGASATEVAFEDLELVIDLAGLDELNGGASHQHQRRGIWRAKFDGAPVELQLFALTTEDGFEFGEPAEILQIVATNRSNRKGGGGFTYVDSKPLLGPMGTQPYGWFGVHNVYEGTDHVRDLVIYGGVTTKAGYFFEVSTEDEWPQERLDKFAEWAAKSARYTGEPFDPNWTDEEADDRWEKCAPDKVKDDGRILRTKYYIVFTNLGRSTASAFMDAADENYEAVREVFPFEDIPGQRLLPIFYFTNNLDYYDWCVKNIGWTVEQAKRSGGVASGDAYATYHQSIKAPVHIHEQTHQIFRNRLRLSGGGSWFQEGVAEYMSVKPNELNEVKRYAAKDRTTPLAEFMVIPSLLMSSEKGSRKEGGSAAGGAYTQAAAIIEFVRHSDFGRERFLDWMHAMGQVGRGDLPAIKLGISRTLEVSLEEFEAEFKAYWSKRKMSKRDWHYPASDLEKDKKKRKRR